MQQPVRQSRLPVVDVGDDAEISNVRYVHLSCVPGRESAVQGRLPCPVHSLLQLARPLLIPREDTGKRREEKPILLLKGLL
jgi:hypothetical protein